MPVYGSGSASGPQKKPKKKVKRKPPSGGYSSPTAILGAKGQRKAVRAAKSARRARVKLDASRQRKIRRVNKIINAPDYKPPAAVTVDSEGRVSIPAGTAAKRASRDPLVRALRNAPKTPSDAAAALEVASLLPPVRAARAVGTAAKIIDKATDASKVTRLGNKARAAEKAGKTRTAKRARKGERKAAAKAEQRARKSQVRAERAVKGESGAKAAAKRTWKKRQPSILTKPGRKVKRRKRAQGLATIGAASPAAATVATGTALTTAEALKDDPVKTLKTTARVAPGVPAAVIGDIVDLAKAAGGDKKAWEGLKRSQVRYWDSVAKVAKGGPEGVKVVEEELGLIPAATGALTAAGFAKAAGGVPRVRVRASKHDRLAEKARTAGTKGKRKRAREKLEERQASPVERRRQAMREAKRSAATREKIEGGAQDDVKVFGRGRKRLDRRIRRAAETPVTKDVSEADLIQFLGREGLYGRDKDFVLSQVAKRRERLTDPKQDISDADVATRDVIDAILENPRVLDSKNLRATVEGFGKAQARQSVRRHTDRTQRKQETPDPEDQRARLLHVAQAEDILLPEERVPAPLRGKTKVKTRKGEDAKRALVKESTDDFKRAKKLRQEARREEAKAQGARKELSVRRVADDRRTAVRARNKKLRNLEKRRVAWAEKAKAAKKPEARRAAAAKVRDLDEQIKFTKARLEMMASPVRLRTVSRASKHRARARDLREQAELMDLEAKARIALVNRLKHASSLEKRAAKVEGPEADRMRAEAIQLRRSYFEDEAKLRGEFVQETEGRISEKGYADPIYFRESDAADQGGLNVAGEYMGGRIPKTEQMRSGSLARQGRIDESAQTLVENFYRQRQSTEMRTHVRSFLDDNLLDVNGTVKTGAQWRKLASEGKIPDGYTPFPVQEWNRVLQNGRWDEAQGLLGDPLMEAVRLSRGEDGKKYGLVPTAAKQEFRRQMEPMGKGWRGARQIARLQAVAMLGTSPSWFAFQLAATPLALVAHSSNPARWVKVGAKMAKDWRKIPKTERRAFQSQFGGTSADVVELRPQNLTLNPDTVRTTSDAAKVAMKTPMGRVLRHLANGGPLIAGNRKYEAAVRTFAAMLEADLQINPSRVKRFAHAVAGINDATIKDVAHLRGKKLPEVVDFYNRNPKQAKRLTDTVDDALGNWNALTGVEKKAASVLVFYPFLRFSLRWALISMPKNHPIKSAILLNAAQQNAQELDDLTGGGIGFFSDWGNVVIHGDEPQALNLARIAPGGNAVIEALGAGNINLASAARITQPLFGAAALGLAKQDPFTGEQEEDMTRLEIVARQIVGLSPVSRPLAQQIGPERSDVAKAFDKIENRKRGIPGSLVPDVLSPISEMKESADLSRLLDAIGGRPEGSELYDLGADVPALKAGERAADKAQDELTDLLIKLGLTSKQEQRKVKRIGGKNYGKVKYGNSGGSSSSGLGGSGLGGSGLGGGGLGG